MAQIRAEIWRHAENSFLHAATSNTLLSQQTMCVSRGALCGNIGLFCRNIGGVPYTLPPHPHYWRNTWPVSPAVPCAETYGFLPEYRGVFLHTATSPVLLCLPRFLARVPSKTTSVFCTELPLCSVLRLVCARTRQQAETDSACWATSIFWSCALLSVLCTTSNFSSCALLSVRWASSIFYAQLPLFSDRVHWVSSYSYRSVLQNIVSFIGLFCKRDLSF